MCLGHFAVQQKLTEHYKLAIIKNNFLKSEIELLYGPVISLSGIYSKELKTVLKRIVIHKCS